MSFSSASRGPTRLGGWWVGSVDQPQYGGFGTRFFLARGRSVQIEAFSPFVVGKTGDASRDEAMGANCHMSPRLWKRFRETFLQGRPLDQGDEGGIRRFFLELFVRLQEWNSGDFVLVPMTSEALRLSKFARDLAVWMVFMSGSPWFEVDWAKADSPFGLKYFGGSWGKVLRRVRSLGVVARNLFRIYCRDGLLGDPGEYEEPLGVGATGGGVIVSYTSGVMAKWVSHLLGSSEGEFEYAGELPFQGVSDGQTVFDQLDISEGMRHSCIDPPQGQWWRHYVDLWTRVFLYEEEHRLLPRGCVVNTGFVRAFGYIVLVDGGKEDVRLSVQGSGLNLHAGVPRQWTIVPSELPGTGITYDTFFGYDITEADYGDEYSNNCETVDYTSVEDESTYVEEE
jgi:hypothetical protein